MSTAAEHYAAAEALLADADTAVARQRNRLGVDEAPAQLIARAGVHSSLAVAAVLAELAAVNAAESTTLRGVIDVRAVIARTSFARGASS